MLNINQTCKPLTANRRVKAKTKVNKTSDSQEIEPLEAIKSVQDSQLKDSLPVKKRLKESKDDMGLDNTYDKSGKNGPGKKLSVKV